MKEILEDTKLECAKHGTISKIASPRVGAAGDAAAGLDGPSIALKVFVAFATTEAAIACARELHGKQFDGRTVSATFCSESTFQGLLALPVFAE